MRVKNDRMIGVYSEISVNYGELLCFFLSLKFKNKLYEYNH